MSIVLVCLPNAPQVSEEAVKRDAELDKYLESRVEGEKCLVFSTIGLGAFIHLMKLYLHSCMQ